MPSKQHEGPPHHSLSQQGHVSSSSSHQERNHNNNSQNPRTTSSNLQINTTNTKRKSPSSSNNSSNTSSPTASLFSSSGISSGRPVSPHNITSPTTTMNQPLGLIPGISPIHHLHHIYSSKDNTNSDTEDPSYRATTRSVSPSIPIPTSISNNNISPNNSLQNHHQLLNAVTSDHSSNISNVSNNTTSSSSSTNNNNNITGKSHFANRSTARPPSPLFMNAIHSGGNNPYYQQQQQPSTYSDPISQSNNGMLNPQQPFQQLTSFPSSSQFPKNNINNPLRGTATTPVPKRSHGRVKGSPLNNHLGHQRSSSFDIHAIMEHYHPPTTSMIGNSIVQHRLFNHSNSNSINHQPIQSNLPFVTAPIVVTPQQPHDSIVCSDNHDVKNNNNTLSSKNNDGPKMTHSEYITGSNKSPTTNRLSPSELSYDSEDSSTSPSTLTTSTGTSSSKKKPNLRIDIGSNKTVPLAHVPNNNSPFTKQQSTMNPSNVVNQLETLIGSKNVKHTTASENTPTIDKFHNKGRQQQVSIKGFMRPNLYEEDVYDFLSEYPVRSRSVSPPPTTSLFSHHHKKKTPMSTEKKSPSVLVQAVGTKTPTSVKSKDEEDTDDNCVTPPQRKSFSRDDGISDDEEVDSNYVTPPSDIRTVSITEPQTDNFRLIRQPFLPFNDLSSPLSMMRKCQTPVAVKTKAETLSSSFGHIKFYERRRKRYLMMITDKDSSVMEDELNLLREDFIEAKTNIMRRNRKIDQMTFSDMVYTEQFDKNPTSEDDSFESCTQDQTIFLGKKSYEKIARFLTSKMMISLDQLHTDLKAFIIELEEAAALQFPSLSEDSFVLEMKEIAHRIIEAGLSELIKQVYMKDLNDLLVSLRDLHAEADEQDLPRINFSLKELKKLLFIYSRVNRIIAVYNRIPEHLKVLNLPQARKRSGSEAKGIPRVNTPPVTELAHLKKLSLNLDSTLAKKSGSSIDLLHNPSTADKQNLQITNLLKKWQEESTVITPRSEQSTMSSPTHTASSSVTSTPKSPQDTLFCRICEKFIDVDTFEEHTQSCARSHELNMKRIGCEQKFKQLMHQIKKRRREEPFGEIYSLVKACYKAKTKHELYDCADNLKRLEVKLKKKDQERNKDMSTETQIVSVCIDLAEEKNKTLHEYVENFKKVSIMDFTLIKPISKGAYGRVYLARKISTPDIYAIKVIEKQYIYNHKNLSSKTLKNKDKLLTERNVLHQLMKSNHDSKCIVNFYYSFAGKKYFYIVMEYCPGGSLDCLLEQHINTYDSAFDVEKVRKIVAEIILALLELHSNNIVHRDLKPDNMLVDRNGRLKLTDFGLSEIGIMDREEKATSKPRISTPHPSSPPQLQLQNLASSPNNSTESETSDGLVTVPGTPDYIAPELLLGAEHDYAVDYWSLGCITYELLFGVPPFNSDTVEEIFDNILSGEFEWPEDLPPEIQSSGVEDFIRRLLDPNPKTRLGGKDIKDHEFLKPIDWDNLLNEELFTPTTELEDTSKFSPRKHQYPVTPTTHGFLSPFEAGGTSFNSDASSVDSPSPVKIVPSSQVLMSPMANSSHTLSTSIDFSFSSSTAALKELNMQQYNEYVKKSNNNSQTSQKSTKSTGSVVRSLNFSNM